MWRPIKKITDIDQVGFIPTMQDGSTDMSWLVFLFVFFLRQLYTS